MDFKVQLAQCIYNILEMYLTNDSKLQYQLSIHSRFTGKLKFNLERTRQITIVCTKNGFISNSNIHAWTMGGAFLSSFWKERYAITFILFTRVGEIKLTLSKGRRKPGFCIYCLIRILASQNVFLTNCLST